MLCVFTLYSNGNETDSATVFPLIAGSRIHNGFLINHHNRMKILNERAPYSIEMFIARASDGSNPWHGFYRYPLYGVSFMMFELGGPTYLGKAHCIFPFMQFFLTGAERTAGLNARFGAGVAYVEKTFDPVDNYKNTAISSHINAFLNCGMELRLRVATRVHLSGGCAFTHISNGTLKKPNAGLNYVTAHAGAYYAFGCEKTVKPADRTCYNAGNKWQYTVYLSGGLKKYTTYDNSLYAVSGLSFEASRQHLAFTRFGGMIDVFYDTSDYASLIRHEKETTKSQTVKAGIAAGYYFLFGKLSANVQTGGYLHAKNQEFGLIYQRLALRYAVASRINIHLGLKTHWAQADYIEFALGYRI